jgi:hypothetical protein
MSLSQPISPATAQKTHEVLSALGRVTAFLMTVAALMCLISGTIELLRMSQQDGPLDPHNILLYATLCLIGFALLIFVGVWAVLTRTFFKED